MMNWLSTYWGLNRRALLLLCGVLAVLVWFYFTLPTQLFFGDDSRFIYTALHGGAYSRFPDMMFQAELLKWRPVVSGIVSLLVPMFGVNHAAWEAFDRVGTLFALCIFFLTVWTISKRNLWVALVFTLLLGVSRFVYTAVTQAGGIIEWLTLALALLILLEALLYFNNEEGTSPARAVVWFGILLYSNERFVVMIVPLLIFLWLAKRSNLLILMSLALLAANVLIKALIFHFNFLQGTNGQAIKFGLSDIFGFVISGILNLLGYPVIPQYLSGMQYDQLALSQQVPSIFFSIGVLAAFALALAIKRPRLPKAMQEWAIPIILLSALGLLLASACVTVRQETRFLFPPYAVMLLLVAYALAQIQTQRVLVATLTAVIGVSGFLVDTPFHDYVENTWFMSSSHWLDQARNLLIERRSEHSKNVIVITHGVDYVQTFTLNPWFMMTYDPNADYTIAFEPEPPVAGAFRADASYFDANASTAHFRNATGDARMHALLSGSRPRIDLVQTPCKPLADAPSPSAAVVHEGWPSLYDSIATLTMPAGTQCRTDLIHVKTGDQLSFFAAVPELSVHFQGSDIVDAGFVSVIIRFGSRGYRVLDDGPAVAPVDSHIRWNYYSIDLRPFEGKDVSIEFSVTAPHGDAYPGSIAIGLPWIMRR